MSVSFAKIRKKHRDSIILVPHYTLFNYVLGAL